MKLTWSASVEAQLLLVALREEVDQVSRLRPGESLESLFNGNLVCHIDDKDYFSLYSMTSSAIGISRLATVASATEASGASIVGPALDGVQLDTFVRQRRPSCEISGLAEFDVSPLFSPARQKACQAVDVPSARNPYNCVELRVLDHHAVQLGCERDLLELRHSSRSPRHLSAGCQEPRVRVDLLRRSPHSNAHQGTLPKDNQIHNQCRRAS